MHNSLHTATPAPAEQGSHRRQQWPACMCVLGQGKGDPIRQLMAESFCNCWRTKSLPSPGEPSLHPQGWGEEGSTWRREGQEELCTWSQAELRADGLAPASQMGTDPALEAQGSTGAQEDFKSGTEVGAGLSPVWDFPPNSNVNLGCQHMQVGHCHVSVS